MRGMRVFSYVQKLQNIKNNSNNDANNLIDLFSSVGVLLLC